MTPSDKPLELAFTCGRRHRHSSRRQVVECDHRHARREALKCEKTKPEETKAEEVLHEDEA